MIGRLRTTALLILAVVPTVLLALAQPANAHANLVRTDPAQGAVLATAPTRVLLTFDEAVRGVPDGVQVFDARGDLVAVRTTVTGAELAVDLTGPVGDGTTVLTWRVVSDDGHPISGALTFSVGAPSTPAVTTPAGDPSTVPDVPWALTLARWLGYTSLLLTTGLVAFAALFLPTDPGPGHPRRRLNATLRVAAAVAAGAWLAAVPITAVYLLGGGPNLLAQGSTWSSLPPTEYAVAAVVAGGLLSAVALLGTGPAARWRRIAAVVTAAIAATAPALAGHTRAANPEAIVIAADALHLLAGSIWLGGLVGLALTLPGLAGLPSRGGLPGRGAAAAETLARFSTAAAGVLAALVATGTMLAWRILGSWSALVDTGYGRLLLTKIAIALLALAIAAWNRWSLLPRLQQTPGREKTNPATGAKPEKPTRPQTPGRVERTRPQAPNRETRTPHPPLREGKTRPVVRAVVVEAMLLVAALLVTGFLVDTSPEADTSPETNAAADRGPRTTTLGDIDVEADLAPLVRGSNTVTLRLTSATGEPTEGVAPPVVRLSSDRATLGAVPLTQVSPGFYTAQVVIPAPGIWRLQVSLRVTEFTNPVAELDFEIG